MPNRVLMIAYHYPPCVGSSGLQRTLAFSRYLPKYGWQPLILSVTPKAYTRTADDQLEDIPKDVLVTRAFALDTAKHLAVRGSYLRCMALPDRWVSWCLGAVPSGMKLIREYRPKLLWSTYPIASAHLIGSVLHRFSRIPWVADFRDPMVEVDPKTGERCPPDPALRKARLWIEKLAVDNSARSVFCTNGAKMICANRYASIPDRKWEVISNGYDEEMFLELEQAIPKAPTRKGAILLVHSGVLYPGPDRDPSAFFDALHKLRCRGMITSPELRIVLRASGYDDYYLAKLRERGLENVVRLERAISYREALTEMLTAGGLLVFQGYTSNPAIPAKLYEYIRARKPIFAMVDSEGDTAALLRDISVGTIVPLDNAEKICEGLVEFLHQVKQGQVKPPTTQQIQQYSRESQAAKLANLFNDVILRKPPPIFRN